LQNFTEVALNTIIMIDG